MPAGKRAFDGQAPRALSGLDGLRGLRRLRDIELDVALLVGVDRDLAAVGEAPEEQLVGERAADRVLDEARHGTRAHLRIEAVLREEVLEAFGEDRIDL